MVEDGAIGPAFHELSAVHDEEPERLIEIGSKLTCRRKRGLDVGVTKQRRNDRPSTDGCARW